MAEPVEAQGERHSRATIVNSVLLALSRSKLAGLADIDAVRSLLHIEYPDYAGNGSMDLQHLWDILAEFPEFDASGADGPMCLMKSWEERYRMPVELPQHLRELDDKAIALHTATCQVSSTEVAKVFERAARRQSMRVAVETVTAHTPGQSREPTWRDRREVGIAAAVVCVLALGFVAYTVVSNVGGSDWTPIRASDVSSAIPLAKAEKFGDEIAGTLADDAWLKKPADERRKAMRETLEGLSAENIRVFILLDSQKRVRATATWYDDPPKVAVKFR